MREHGYLEGHNLTIALRSADGKKERYAESIGELFAFRPDVLMTWSTPTSTALKQATSLIPIVSISGDPVGLGLAARPPVLREISPASLSCPPTSRQSSCKS